MQKGEVDLVIVGSDRTTRKGDVANKIGTYLKALAARDNDIPFYVALPTSTIDMNLAQGEDIVIENRDSEEVSHILGWDEERSLSSKLRVIPNGSEVLNPGFDVTPSRLVTCLITEKGICPATKEAVNGLFEG